MERLHSANKPEQPLRHRLRVACGKAIDLLAVCQKPPCPVADAGQRGLIGARVERHVARFGPSGVSLSPSVMKVLVLGHRTTMPLSKFGAAVSGLPSER